MVENFTCIAPGSPVAPYLGGKRSLSRRICALLRTIPHHTYVEPFVGPGGIILRRDYRPRDFLGEGEKA